MIPEQPKTWYRSYTIMCRRFGKVDYRTCFDCNLYQKLRGIPFIEDVDLSVLHAGYVDLLKESVAHGDEALLWHHYRCNRLLGFWTTWNNLPQISNRSSDSTSDNSSIVSFNLAAYQFVKALVVSSTHWDPEVHQTSAVMRLRLIGVIREIIDTLELDESAPPFTMDGQVSPILDYLRMLPNEKGRVENLVKRGRLAVGPWWIVPDTLHPSGETLVRNLIFGIRAAESLGNCLKAGYTPDPFGMNAQLPQLLVNCGIDSCFTRRGIGNEVIENEFNWSAPDGSTVLTIHLRWGYRTIGLLPRDTDVALESIRSVIERMVLSSTTNNVLLMSGDNNMGIQKDLHLLIDRVGSRVSNVGFVFGTPADFVDRVKSSQPQLSLVRGELIGGRYQMHLTGSMASRIPMKQAAFLSVATLEWQAEPLSTLAFLLGFLYPRSVLHQLWELAIRNSFHDAISGTHVDEVHSDILNRYHEIYNTALTLTEEALTCIASQVDIVKNHSVLIISGSSIRERIPITVKLPKKIDNITALKGEDGEEIPVQLVEDNNNYYWVFTPKPFNAVEHRVYIPSIGIPESNLLTVTSHTIQNAWTLLNVEDNGNVSVTRLHDGQQLTIGPFRSIGDRGDLFRPWLLSELVCDSRNSAATISVLEVGPVRATLRVELVMKVPRGLSESREERRDEFVEQIICTDISLYAASPRIDITIHVKNIAEDHLFQLGIFLNVAYPLVQAAQSYFKIERPSATPNREMEWIEQAGPGYHQAGFIRLGSWSIFAPGTPEYMSDVSDIHTEIWLTQLRCVGVHGLAEMPDRAWNAGMPELVPDAQCIGLQEYRYSIWPLDSPTCNTWELLRAFVCSPSTRLLDRQRGSLPPNVSYLEVAPHDLVLAALKHTESGEGIVIRLFNDSSRPITQAKVRLFICLREAWYSNMLEEEKTVLEINDDNSVCFDVKPFEIVTLLFKTSAKEQVF